MRIFLSSLLLALAMALGLPRLSAGPSGSLNYYVSAGGSDATGDGSSSHPWATIAHAASEIGPGATVHVAGGTYQGSFQTYASGTSTARITYISDEKWGAKLVGAKRSTWANFGSYVDIVGFDVTGLGLNGLYIEGDHTRIIGNNVHNILNSTCPSMGGSGINLNATNADAIGNFVHDNGPFPSPCGYVHGIYFLKAGGHAFNNISFRNAGYGIHLWHDASNIVIANNTLFKNLFGGVVIGAGPGTMNDYTVVINNIVYDNTRGITETGSTGAHNIFQNNLLYQNTLRNYRLQNGLTLTATVSADPQFVNYTGDASGDYHLRSSSPAIDAGTKNDAPQTDFDGVTRPQGRTWDIGAYEYVPASARSAPLSPFQAFADLRMGSPPEETD